VKLYLPVEIDAKDVATVRQTEATASFSVTIAVKVTLEVLIDGLCRAAAFIDAQEFSIFDVQKLRIAASRFEAKLHHAKSAP
jgi:hypothetical protein